MLSERHEYDLSPRTEREGIGLATQGMNAVRAIRLSWMVQCV
jgi:hypothetical protein